MEHPMRDEVLDPFLLIRSLAWAPLVAASIIGRRPLRLVGCNRQGRSLP